MAEREFAINGSDTVEVHTASCFICGERERVLIPYAGYVAWIVEGEYLQVALADLTSDERELVLTGIHPACWNDIAPEELEEGTKNG